MTSRISNVSSGGSGKDHAACFRRMLFAEKSPTGCLAPIWLRWRTERGAKLHVYNDIDL